MKRAIFLTVIILMGMLVLPINTKQAYAATFNKNYIIDDNIFTDANSMNVSQIQSFLDSRGSLLANWVDNVDMRRPSDDCIVHHATGMSAAEIIYEAATAWNAQVYDSDGCAISGAYWGDSGYSNYTLQTISPKALLVTLEKEQSLISADGSYSTDPNDYKSPACCSSNEYKLARATGYGVPDSGGINEKYLGFYNQINWAAWQLRYNYERAGGNTSWDNVSYLTYTGPMVEGSFRRCGTCNLESFDGYYPIDGTPLYMNNRATASLYFYTPHTYPGYFGNFNFFNFFTEWFGSTYANSFAYSYHSQSANPAMAQGFSNSSRLRFKNTGSEPWYDEDGILSAPSGTLPIYLTTDNPTGRKSGFALKWSTPTTPTKQFNKVYEADGLTMTSDQDVVMPGQVAEFNVVYTAPDTSAPGNRREYFTLYRAAPVGGGRLTGQLIWASPKIIEAKYRAEFIKQGYPSSLFGSDAEGAYIRVKNTGNVDWYAAGHAPEGVKPVRLATSVPLNGNSNFSRDWFTANRPIDKFTAVYESDGTTPAASQRVVKPGQIVVFSFDFAATRRAVTSNNRQYFRLVRERASAPTFGPSLWLPVNYNSGTYVATWAGQTPNKTITAGSTVDFIVRYRNDGTATWHDTTGFPGNNNLIRIVPIRPLNRTSDFVDVSWLSPNRPNKDFNRVLESDGSTLAANQHAVEPGQIGEFMIRFDVPADTPPGLYQEYFTLAKDGAASWKLDSSTVMWFYINVQ